MELFLIRHGQSFNNSVPDKQRVEDPALTELGREQAVCLAEWAKSLELTRLFTSPFLRTLQTTQKVHETTGLQPEIRVALHEQGGCYSGYAAVGRVGQPGLNRSSIALQFASYEIDQTIDEDGWWKRKPYETREQAQQRASSLLRWTREQFDDSQRVAFVMHADFKLRFLEQFCSQSLSVPYNTSITRLSITRNECRLEDYNSIVHLPPRLVTF